MLPLALAHLELASVNEMAWSLVGWLLGGGIGLVGVLVYLLVRYGKASEKNSRKNEELKSHAQVVEVLKEIALDSPATDADILRRLQLKPDK